MKKVKIQVVYVLSDNTVRQKTFDKVIPDIHDKSIISFIKYRMLPEWFGLEFHNISLIKKINFLETEKVEGTLENKLVSELTKEELFGVIELFRMRYFPQKELAGDTGKVREYVYKFLISKQLFTPMQELLAKFKTKRFQNAQHAFVEGNPLTEAILPLFTNDKEEIFRLAEKYDFLITTKKGVDNFELKVIIDNKGVKTIKVPSIPVQDEEEEAIKEVKGSDLFKEDNEPDESTAEEQVAVRLD